MPARLEFEVRFRPRSSEPSEEAGDGPMRILILGDFSGRGSQSEPSPRASLAERRPIPVDVDTFDEVLARLSPSVECLLGQAGEPAVVEFQELEDFHPDSVYRRLPVFGPLRSIGDRLRNAATFGAASAELREWVRDLPPASESDLPGAGPGKEVPLETEAATLARLLGQRSREAQSTAPGDPVAALVRKLAAAHGGASFVPEPGADQDVYVAALGEAASAQMRNVLHAPAFQALEAAWRSLHRLVTNLETGEGLSLHLLDVTQQELAEDLGAAGSDPRASTLWRVLGGGEADVPGQKPWSLLVGNYTFGSEAEDLRLLECMGAIGSWAGAPFLAAADRRILGCTSAADLADPAKWAPAEPAWHRLRTSPVAPWLGLALPRVLLRLPYGPKRDPIEAFSFDEVGTPAEHGAFLWGNPAFACAWLIAQAYKNSGWSMAPGDVAEVGDLPSFTYEEDGERRMLPCGEVWLGERAGQELLARGLMPLLSRKDRNAVRLMRFQSLSDPARALAGPWGG